MSIQARNASKGIRAACTPRDEHDWLRRLFCLASAFSTSAGWLPHGGGRHFELHGRVGLREIDDRLVDGK
jgi:hypothetical protein